MSAAVETRKTVTVLFCDVTGSTELGEQLDPEPLRRVMLRYFDEMRRVLERHGGTVEKFIGDAVVGVFGIPTVHEDDALRAVRAAAEMQNRLRTLNEELESSWGVRLDARIGVNTGEVVAGEGVAVVAGDAINVAARLQQSGDAGDVLLGASTYALVSHAVRAAPLAARSMKGKTAPVSLWKLEGVARDASMMSARPDTPLVGRAPEVDALRTAFDRAAHECRCNLFTVVGPAGIGKSRLARELCQAVCDDAGVAVGRCLSYGDGITFWPVHEVVRELAGISGDDSPSGARAKIDALAPAEDAALVAGRVAASIGLGDDPVETPDCFWAVRRLLESAATRRPLLLVFEDLHWAEPTLLDLIEHVAERAAAPILLLCLARPELVEERPSWTATLTLDALEPGEARELAGHLGCAGLADRIAETTGGNPLFVEELARMLADNGDRFAIPPTISALLAARLDRLEHDERIVLQRAAVAGDQFWWSSVAELAPEELRARVPALLQALVRKRLILPDASTAFPEDAFRFAHLLLQEAAYASLPKETRAELHELYASWLERKAGDRAIEYEEILGYHLEQAYRARAELGPTGERERELARRAGVLLAMAGRRAFERSDMPAALSLLERAVTLLPDDDAARLEPMRLLSTARWWGGDMAGADALLATTIDAAVTHGDKRQEWYALLERAARGSISGGEKGVEELAAVAQDAVAVFKELDDAVGLARAWRRVAHAELIRCQFSAAQTASERALRYAQSVREPHEEARIVDGLCTSLLLGPASVGDAVTRCEELLAGAAGRRVVEANVAVSLAGLHAMRGSFDEARALIAHAQTTYEELDLKLALAGLTQVSGPIELLAGNAAGAEEQLRMGFRILEGMTAAGYQASLLAEALYAQARYAEAEEYARVAEESSSRDNIAAQVAWRSVRAKLAARFGNAEAAADLARKAEAIAAETDALNLHGDALVALAEVLAVGRLGDPFDPAQRAAALYARKGNVVAARQTSAIAAPG